MVNRHYCEKEERVFAAGSAGVPDAAILDHAHECEVCSQALVAAAHLRQEAALADHETASLPDPGLIWRRAQASAREAALAKAAMPIRIMRACAALFAILASAWIASRLWHSPTWISDLALARAAEASWLTAFTGATLFGITMTFGCIVAGSWYMLREK